MLYARLAWLGLGKLVLRGSSDSSGSSCRTGSSGNSGVLLLVPCIGLYSVLAWLGVC